MVRLGTSRLAFRTALVHTFHFRPLNLYPDFMVTDVSEDDAVKRASQLQDARIEAVRDLARARSSLGEANRTARQRLAQVEAENAALIATAEREDLRTYTAATRAGWSGDELRKIGFDQPAKLRRVRRRKRKDADLSEPEKGMDPAPDEATL